MQRGLFFRFSLVAITILAVMALFYVLNKNANTRVLLQKEILKSDSILSAKLVLEEEFHRNHTYLKAYQKKLHQQTDYILALEKTLGQKSFPATQSTSGSQNGLTEKKLRLANTEIQELNQKIQLLEKENQALKTKYYSK